MVQARTGVWLGLLLANVALVRCIFEDQAGASDWKKENIGNIKRAVYQRKQVYVATDSNVVAAMNVRTGNIEWRHALPQGPSRQSEIFTLRFF